MCKIVIFQEKQTHLIPYIACTYRVNNIDRIKIGLVGEVVMDPPTLQGEGSSFL